MILLDGHSLKQKRKVPLVSMQLTLNERDSTASMVPGDMTGIAIGSWFQDDTNPGKGIVWRVKSLRQAWNTDTMTVQLEHAINTLRDRIMFGEVTPAKMAGNSKATKCTAKQAVQYILSQQSDWQLGTFSFDVTNPYKFDGNTLYDALETVTDSLSGAMWNYDMSVYPFKLNILKTTETIGSVMRPGRNLKTITRTIDKSGMYTRFYPIGKNDLHVPNGYVQKNTGTYGVISKVETDQSIETVDELTRWANERLAVHAEPTVTIDIDGLELADATNEPLDRLTVNRICLVPLYEFGTEIKERIKSLSYADKVGQPENVKVTLANNRQDVVKIIADAIKKSGGGGRAAARQDKEDNAWFEDTNDHVAMVAKGIIGVDAKGNPNWTRLSQIIVDGTGIHQRVESQQEEITNAWTAIDQNEDGIKLEAARRKDKDDWLKGKIDVQADKINLVVTKKHGAWTVDAASIVAGINTEADGGGSYVRIKAKTIELSGYVTISELEATKASIKNLKTGNTTADWLKAVKMGCNNLTVNTGGTFYMRGYAATWKLIQYKDHSGSNKEMYVLGR